ncbi:isopenicillin N synthase family dioxygenase [Ramlibacter sp.]|uniref:isopenicillin N synthase family dioxygenase n=1 Tax=Ramlibacter sp. TaxID=1917967 RepID=UPI003D0A58CC
MLPPSRALAFSDIPVVDIAALVGGDESNMARTVDALSRACSEVGFFYVSNHGLPRAALDELVAQTKAFFSLPLARKEEVAIADSPQFRGYLPLNYKGTGNKGNNIQEGFLVMPERPTNPRAPTHGPNRWPSALPALKPAMTNYFAHANTLANRLLRGFSMALGMGPDGLASRFSEPMTLLKLNHYPAQDKPEHDLDIGVVGHTDSGGFTILWQDDVGGLEVLNKAGEWVVAPPIPDTFVINVGDMMQAWTNGRFASTLHRVVNRYGTDRYSIPFFMNPNYDVVVEPLLGEAPADFKPFVSGEYTHDIYKRIYPQRSPQPA